MTMNPTKTTLLALVASLSLACSGESEPAPPEPAETTDPNCEASGIIDPTLLIDDLEDGDPLIAIVATRNGSWWVSTDGTDGTINPQAEQGPPAERILGGRCGSDYAMHVAGAGFTGWGAVLSAGFRYNATAEPIDATNYRGLSFYARKSDDTNSVIRMQLQDSSTYPEGGKCNIDPESPDACYNGFGTQLFGLTAEWQKYSFDFTELSQRPDWGYRADALDLTALFGLEFNLDPNRAFDLWVDDVWFYE